jgi:hypothetical protein
VSEFNEITTDPTIQYMSGCFPGSSLVMVNPHSKLLIYARAHVIPDDVELQAAFPANISAILQSWQDAVPNFKKDMLLPKLNVAKIKMLGCLSLFVNKSVYLSYCQNTSN